MAVSVKAHPEDQRREAATRDLFQAVGSVLESSLRDGLEEPEEAHGSQVRILDAALTPIACPAHTSISRWIFHHALQMRKLRHRD